MTEAEQIQSKYEQLIAACQKVKPLTQEEEDNIFRAFTVARNAHEGTRRKSGEPYIFHPLSVALIAIEEVGLGPVAVICALLHDVVEDTEITLEQIRILFGDRVALIVDGVTKIDSAAEKLQIENWVEPQTHPLSQTPVKEEEATDDNARSKQAENYRKILLAMCDDAYVIFLKLCDRLHNMRTLGSMKDTKQLAISSETQYLYIPLAHRLGLYNIKTELEELVMRYTNPTRYAQISELIKKTAGTETRLKVCFTQPIRQILDEHGYNYYVKTRVKSVYSCWKKMENKGVDFDEIFDLYAMRIILDTDDRQDCFKVYSLITQLFPPNPTRFRDWITIPKNNGYESLHTTVMSPIGHWVEVQIRTRQMDEVAEKGMAAHFLYKEAHPEEQSESNNAVEDWLRSIRTSLESSERNALDLVEEFKEALYTKEIYIFTPKGETIKLPSRSTVLDFAFAIHTDLGLTCMGAKVNSKVVSVGHKLHSGDQVQVLSSRKVKPEDSWLSLVRTSRAKEHLKDYLQKEKMKYFEQGDAILRAFAAKYNLRSSAKSRALFLKFFNITSKVDLCYRLATGEITESQLEQCFNVAKSTPSPNLLFPQVKTPFLLDKCYQQMESYPASCCNPVPGDEVVGIMDDDKKRIAIHRSNCREALHEMSTHEDKTVRARWVKGGSIGLLTGISLTAIDRKGIIQEIIKVITQDMDVNIRAFTLESIDNIGHGKVMLYVYNLEMLNKLIKMLESIEGIESVHRI